MLAAVISWIIIGAIAGWIASMITGTEAGRGFFGNVIVGILGAAIGGLLLNLFGYNFSTGLNLVTLITAILGAVILIWLVRAVRHDQV
jgi:uncharacterized membrane protein YeaQ/YmgE (transglycosylase-associated protein family)